MYIFVFFYVSFITSHVLAAKAASKITFCQLNTCRGPLYGECEDTADGFVCHCTSQFKGETCGELFKPGDNPCLQKPCWSGGNCTQIGNEFSCKCPAGRTGLDCKTAIDPITTPIRPLVCFNNATLSNNVCVCLENYIGISCETFGNLVFFSTKKLKFLKFFFKNQVPPPTDAYVKVFNKGWYTATIKLTYRLNEVSWEEKRTITGV